MKEYLNYKTNSGQFLLVMMLINAVILREAYIENANLYWALILTVPVSIFAVIRVAIPKRDAGDSRRTGAPANHLRKQRSKIIKTRDYDYAEF